jgi:hypothetical protein
MLSFAVRLHLASVVAVTREHSMEEKTKADGDVGNAKAFAMPRERQHLLRNSRSIQTGWCA